MSALQNKQSGFYCSGRFRTSPRTHWETVSGPVSTIENPAEKIELISTIALLFAYIAGGQGKKLVSVFEIA